MSSSPNRTGRSIIAIEAVVSGRVQGVAYRQSCCRRARELGLDGWVRNARDGNVELVAQGDEAAIDTFLDWLWMGPPYASVINVESTMIEPDPRLQDFLVSN